MNTSEMTKQLWAKALFEFNPNNFEDNNHLGLFESFEFYAYHILNYKSQWKLIENFGPVVLSGPFKGLKFPMPEIINNLESLLGKDGGSAFISKYLLGTYESELHKPILSISNNEYDSVVDLGCSLGYYAAGLGKMFPNAHIHAYDANPKIKDSLSALINENELSSRTTFGDFWRNEHFEIIKNQRSLIFCDIEGAEIDLLDPSKNDMLKDFDFIVEMHDVFNKSISKEICRRFENSHQIEVYKNNSYEFNLPPESQVLTDLELSAVLNEMRGGETPWALLRSKSRI